MEVGKKYTFSPIKGSVMEPLKRGMALVLEGGGLRGYYTAGVFEAFLERDLMFPYIAAVSAGSGNALSYISGQKMRAKQIIENYVCDRRYLSKGNLIRHGSMFDFDFIYNTIPKNHIMFDWDCFSRQQVRFLTGALNCHTGRTEWFEKEDMDRGFGAAVASCSVPVISKIARFKGMELLDGGISDPIPIEKSLKDGNLFHVIVLTRNTGYRKKPFRYGGLLKAYYRKYPAVVQAVMRRHETYNRQLDLCEKLESEGRALIIRPQAPLKVGRTTADKKTLLELYDEGIAEARPFVDKILAAAREIGGPRP